MNRTASPALRALPVAGLALLLLAGCGASASSGTASAASGSSAAASGRPGAGTRPAGFGGLSGPIASVGTSSFTLTAASGTAISSE